MLGRIEKLVPVALVLSVVIFNYAARGTDGASTFNYRISNNIREPMFDESSDIIIDGRPLIRYMEDIVLLKPTQFKSFTVNFTNPYGALVTSINGVMDTFHTDGHYLEFFVNHQALSLGVSFYIPQENDIVELTFVKENGFKMENPY